MILEKIKWIKLRREWYRRNAHNSCAINAPFDIDKVSIGHYSYGMINPFFGNNENEKLVIGDFCSIGEGTRFIFAEHNYKRLSTFPFDAYVLGKPENNPTRGPIIIEDDVWIGANCIILSGVTIHQGAVVGAGSVVTKDVPAYGIYAGDKVVKYRFSQETVEKLIKVDYSKLTKDVVSKYREELYNSAPDSEDFLDSELYRILTEQ